MEHKLGETPVKRNIKLYIQLKVKTYHLSTMLEQNR
jgi:hypothetical protein